MSRINVNGESSNIPEIGIPSAIENLRIYQHKSWY